MNNSTHTLLQFFYVPMGRWPLRAHLILSMLLLLCMAALGWNAIQLAERHLLRLRAEHADTRMALGALQDRGSVSVRPDFVQTLPSTRQADDVLRDMGRYAQDAGVQINTVAIDTQAATAAQLGRVYFTIAAASPYKSLKAWLADLLGRYPALAVDSLRVQAQPNDPIRQDVHLSLVWYVKD